MRQIRSTMYRSRRFNEIIHRSHRSIRSTTYRSQITRIILGNKKRHLRCACDPVSYEEPSPSRLCRPILGVLFFNRQIPKHYTGLSFFLFVFVFIPFILSSPLFCLSFPVVNQISSHISGSHPPFPTTVRDALYLYPEKTFIPFLMECHGSKRRLRELYDATRGTGNVGVWRLGAVSANYCLAGVIICPPGPLEPVHLLSAESVSAIGFI